MKKLVIGIVIGLLVASIGYAAKEVIINRGICDKAKTRCILITQNREANSMQIDAYWDLLDQNKRIIDDSQITPALQAAIEAINKRLTNKITAKELTDLTTNKLSTSSTIEEAK